MWLSFGIFLCKLTETGGHYCGYLCVGFVGHEGVIKLWHLQVDEVPDLTNA